MPELPEVETVRRGLARHAVGKRIEEVKIFDPVLIRKPSLSAFIRGLRRKAIADVARRGKYLLMHLDNGKVWVVHLRMTGRLIFGCDGRPKTDKATRAVIALSGGTRNCTYLWFSDARRFGEWYLVRRPEDVPLISRMGPEPLEIGRAEFVGRVKGRNRQIKALLLDQTFLGGIGNIYACEALYRSGIHPRLKSYDISYRDINKLYEELKATLKDSIRAGGSSIRNYRKTDGSEGWYARKLLVYGKEGGKCPRCGGRIRRREISSRGTFYCPGCQR